LFPVLLSLLTLPGLLSAGRAGLVARQLRTALRLVRSDSGGGAEQPPDAEWPGPEAAYLDPELFVSLSQRISQSLDRASNWTNGLSRSQQHLGQALRQYLIGVGGNTSPAAASPEYHAANRQLLASYVAFNGLSPPPSAVVSPADSVATLMKNPLKAARLLRPSPHPASLFRMLNASQ
jgi:hypothetical protein